jgi:hypothetical protein
MFSRALAFLPQLLNRMPRTAAFGVRLYIALVVIQFVCGFMVGAGLIMFDYNLDFVSAFLPVDDPVDD